MAAGGQFGWSKITFHRISRHFRSIRSFFFFFKFFGWPKITFDRISRHFKSIRIFFLLTFLTKWPPGASLDNRKSLSIAFLVISDQYAAFLFFEFFYKMAAGGHFGWPKITFDHISRHCRSIRNFFFWFFFKMAAAGHFGFRFWAKSIGTSLYSMSVATSNMKLIGAFLIKLYSV